MATIQQISNNESGGSVRAKLNQLISENNKPKPEPAYFAKVSDYTELSALTGMQDDDLVYITSEGISGTVKYDSDLSGVNNEGTIIDGWQRIDVEVIQSEWFGEGETGIQKALDIAGKIPVMCSTSYTADIGIEIDSNQNLIFNENVDINVTNDLNSEYIITNKNAPTITRNGANQQESLADETVQDENITIIGGHVNGITGYETGANLGIEIPIVADDVWYRAINFVSVKNAKVQGFKCTEVNRKAGFDSANIQLFNCYNSEVDSCRTIGSTKMGIRVRDGNNNVVKRNYCYGQMDSGIGVIGSHDSKILNNIVEYCGTNPTLTTINFAGTQTVRVGASGIACGSLRMLVSGNHVFNCPGQINGNGITIGHPNIPEVIVDADGTIVTGNHCYDNGTKGIFVQGGVDFTDRMPIIGREDEYEAELQAWIDGGEDPNYTWNTDNSLAGVSISNKGIFVYGNTIEGNGIGYKYKPELVWDDPNDINDVTWNTSQGQDNNNPDSIFPNSSGISAFNSIDVNIFDNNIKGNVQGIAINTYAYNCEVNQNRVVENTVRGIRNDGRYTSITNNTIDSDIENLSNAFKWKMFGNHEAGDKEYQYNVPLKLFNKAVPISNAFSGSFIDLVANQTVQDGEFTGLAYPTSGTDLVGYTWGAQRGTGTPRGIFQLRRHNEDDEGLPVFELDDTSTSKPEMRWIGDVKVVNGKRLYTIPFDDTNNEAYLEFFNGFRMVHSIGSDLVVFENRNLTKLVVGGTHLDFEGITGSGYFGANYALNSYVQKKYVDDKYDLITTENLDVSGTVNFNVQGFSNARLNLTATSTIGFSDLPSSVLNGGLVRHFVITSDTQTEMCNFDTSWNVIGKYEPTLVNYVRVVVSYFATSGVRIDAWVRQKETEVVKDDIDNLKPRNVDNDTSTIALLTSGGTYRNDQTNSATDYTVTIDANAITGAFDKIRINAATEPTVNTVNTGKISGADFQANTDMDMVIYTEDLSAINYYFLER